MLVSMLKNVLKYLLKHAKVYLLQFLYDVIEYFKYFLQILDTYSLNSDKCVKIYFLCV